MKNKHFYTNEIDTLFLISLLKKHNIKKVVVSPGATNISFVASIQIDPYFEIFSAIDERSAAFIACGLSEESKEPVVLSCTGATASRNYLPGLTDAFYKKIPVLAITSTQHLGRVNNYVAQVIDRSSPFNDLVKKSYQIETSYSYDDRQTNITKINEAILELTHNIPGPIHINLETTYSNKFNIKKLPNCRCINRINKNGNFPQMVNGKIGIYIGSHKQFSKQETEAIDKFCLNNNAIVICDHISNYRGKYRFLANFVNSQQANLMTKYFDLIIYIGYIQGAYINFSGKELWRVNEDGIIRDPYKNITNVFEMKEIDFFNFYSKTTKQNTLFDYCNKQRDLLLSKKIDLPFSNMWVAKETAHLFPKKSIIHFGILNSLRVWNYFETPDSVLCFSNTGGFGIDGCLSSFLGSAIANQNKEHFLIIGDLAFFYDINALCNKLPNNIHILLVNNGIGVEFKNYNHRAYLLGNEANEFIAAKGHNGYKNPDLVKQFCRNLKIEYHSAKTKEEYNRIKEIWLKKHTNPILLEIFVDDSNESKALYIMNSLIKDKSFSGKIKNSFLYNFMKNIIWRI